MNFLVNDNSTELGMIINSFKISRKGNATVFRKVRIRN